MIPLWMQIGFFIWRLPARLERRPLDQFLAELRSGPRVPAGDVDIAVRRIARIRRRWLRLRPLASRNTCYTRAMVLFRFLDPKGGELTFHLGTEPARAPGSNIHGHAWVTLDGRVLEPFPEALSARLSNLYAFPPRSADALSLPPLEGLAKHPAASA